VFIIRLIRFLRGYVVFIAVGGFAERFLNGLREQNIALWDLKTSPESITGKISARHYRTAAKFAVKSGIRMRMKEKCGLPFFTRKYRKRFGLMVGTALFLCLLIFVQNFVWTLEVKGNERNSTERIRYVLSEYGLQTGAFLPSLDIRKIEEQAVLELEHISWMTINNYGSKVVVELKETVDPPKVIDDDLPVNIIALKSGVVRRTEAYEGKLVVEPGQIVSHGDLLISGVLDGSEEKVTFTHARGKIYAETFFTETFEVMKEENVTRETGKRITRNYLKLFEWTLPLFLSLPVNGEYRISVNVSPVCLFGNELPFSLLQKHYDELQTTKVIYDKDSAEYYLEQRRKNYRDTQLSDVDILSEEVSFSELDDRYRLTVDYTCLENIALEQKLFQ